MFDTALQNQLDPTDDRLTGNQNYEVKRLDERRLEIARQIALGGSNVQIAQRLDCSEQTVSNVRNNPLVAAVIKAFSSERNEKVGEIIDEVVSVAPAALKLLEKTIKVDVTKDGQTGARLTQIPELKDQLTAARSVLALVPKPTEDTVEDQVDEAALARIKQKAIKIRSDYNTMAEDAQFKEI